METDAASAATWASMAGFFARANGVLQYFVIRNFEGLADRGPEGLHGDVDVVVRYRSDARRLLHLEKGRARIGGVDVHFDIHHPGDGRYPANWYRDMLRRRVLVDRVYTPCPEDHFYSLLYHVLVQKPSVPERYRGPLDLMGEEAGLSPRLSSGSTTESTARLKAWLDRNGYAVPVPTVGYVNMDTLRALGVPRARFLTADLWRLRGGRVARRVLYRLDEVARRR